jgi:hypothetical protein
MTKLKLNNFEELKAQLGIKTLESVTICGPGVQCFHKNNRKKRCKEASWFYLYGEWLCREHAVPILRRAIAELDLLPLTLSAKNEVNDVEV